MNNEELKKLNPYFCGSSKKGVSKHGGRFFFCLHEERIGKYCSSLRKKYKECPNYIIDRTNRNGANKLKETNE